MIYIDKNAYTNKMADIHPMEKFIFAILTMIICLLSKNFLIPIVIILLMGFITVFIARIPPLFYLWLLLTPSGFLFVGVATVALGIITSTSEVLWHVNLFNINIGITRQSLNYAVLLFTRSLGTVSCLYFLSLTTPLVDIMSIFRKFKVPELFIELMSLIYRFIFMLVMIAGQIHTSQTSRLGYSTFKNQFRSMGQLISSLFIISYKKANDLFIALESRCYNGRMNVLEKKYKFSAVNIIMITLIEVSLVIFEVFTGKLS